MVKPKEVGLEYGFAQPHEVTAHPMTREEYPRWFGTWQGRAMLAFKIMENLVRLDLPMWGLDIEERGASTWIN